VTIASELTGGRPAGGEHGTEGDDRCGAKGEYRAGVLRERLLEEQEGDYAELGWRFAASAARRKREYLAVRRFTP
jgi:hypothetical protein